MELNIILLTDSYKFTHWKQYPAGTQEVYSYLESRGGLNPTLFFGLQILLKKYLTGKVVTPEKVDYAEKRVTQHLGNPKLFNRQGWDYIVKRHGGYLPIEVRAVPEGTILNNKNVLMTVRNTDPNCYWLTNYLETLLVQTWYPCTIASNGLKLKRILSRYLNLNGDPSGINFKMHDFGFRGVSSVETAGIGGCAHLVNFSGTDTFEGVEYASRYYKANMAGFSIPASEHSTITAWGREHELDAMRNMLTQYPDGLVACVSDSYDIFNACEKYWGTYLKNEILARNGTLVVRPDSGDPPSTVLKVLEILGEKLGHTVNNKGYKVLVPQVRVIQGDGIDAAMMEKILQVMHENKWSADNIAFGSGGGLLQKFDRDTGKYAFKCSNIVVNGENREVYKDPVTDPGKVSKRGRLALERVIGSHGHFYKTVQEDSAKNDQLQTVFIDGFMVKEFSFDEVRQNSAVSSLYSY